MPYQPFAEALGRYASACPAAELRGTLGATAGELSRLVPGLAEPAAGPRHEPLRAEPETERYRLFEAVARLAGGVSLAAPVLLVLDDLHWAGKPTLLLLRHLLRAATREPR